MAHGALLGRSSEPPSCHLRKPLSALLTISADSAYPSNFKVWLRGTYRGVSDQQMQVHLDEFVFRFNRWRTPMAAFQTLLGIGSHLPPTTYEEVKSGPTFAELTG